MTNEREVNKRRKVYKRWLFIETSCAGSLSKAESLSGASSFSLISTHASSLHTHTPYKRLFIVNTETYFSTSFYHFSSILYPPRLSLPRTRELVRFKRCVLVHYSTCNTCFVTSVILKLVSRFMEMVKSSVIWFNNF